VTTHMRDRTEIMDGADTAMRATLAARDALMLDHGRDSEKLRATAQFYSGVEYGLRWALALTANLIPTDMVAVVDAAHQRIRDASPHATGDEPGPDAARRELWQVEL
jgi:hypothetical protein